MIDGLRPYPEMKASGLAWLGDVPAHWEVKRLRNLCTRVTSGSRGWSRYMADCGPFFIRIGNLTRGGIDLRLLNLVRLDLPVSVRGECLRTQILPDDLLISITAWIGSVAVVPSDLGEAYVSQHVSACRLRRGEVEPRWAAYVIASPLGQAHGALAMNGGTKQGLSLDDVKNYPILTPPLDEQRLIVRFLDWHGAQTAKLVRAKKKIIALLNEQKQAIIHRAVTRGLDPNAKLKPSGIPWLGDVPEGWEVASLRHRYDQCLGKMLDAKRITGAHLLPYLRNTDVQWERINLVDLPAMDVPPQEYDRYTLRAGDLIVCEGGEVGRAAIWSRGLGICAFQKALHRLRPRNPDRDFPRFLLLQLRIAVALGAFVDGHESTIAHLTGEKLRAHRFPFPSFEDQQRLVAACDIQSREIDRGVDSVEREIALIQEFRTRLIADVVTGKLDVRAAAAGLPEVTEIEPIDDLTEGDDLDEAIDETENEEVAA